MSSSKKNGFFEEYKKEFLKSRKRSRKATYKLMNTDVQIKKNIYKSLTRAPKRIERMIAFLNPNQAMAYGITVHNKISIIRVN